MTRNFSVRTASKQTVSVFLHALAIIARWLGSLPWKKGAFAGCAGQRTILSQLTASTAVLLIALLGCLATSPQLHEFLHRDAGHADHDCVVTAFQAGEALFVAPEFPLAPTWIFLSSGVSFRSDDIPVRPGNLRPPSCGPPAAA